MARFRWRCVYVIFLSLFIALLLHAVLYIPPPQRRDWWPIRPHSQRRENALQLPHAWTEKTWRMTLPELRDMIAGTNGFYVRDWSVGLGWNNLRYTIEAALLHAKLLNRVLVLPSFVYARSCEYSADVCFRYGLFVDRAEAVGWDTWQGAPLNTLAWQLPMQVMLDLPHVRETHPVVLASEFFELHGLDPSFESLAGDWNRGDYEENVTFPSIHVIPNGDYDSLGVVRVDTLQDLPVLKEKNAQVDERLKAALGNKQILEWDAAVQALRAEDLSADLDIDGLIISGDWVITHTFLGAGGMDYTKTVVDPIKQVVPRSRVRGFVDDYLNVKAEVLLLEGEIHLGRKPGGLQFTSQAARDAFARIVLFSFRPVAPVRELAYALAQRMKERCGGRMWMAAHMRRGDFVAVGWAMEKSLEGHLARVQKRLAIGRERLEQQSVIPETYKITGLPPDDTAWQLDPPQPGDPLFLATDERDAQSLAYLRNHSAVLIHDILTIEDRRTFGWPLLFTDVLALVEQSIAVHSSFFYGHVLSSFAGGVLNMRAARGADPRTIFIE